MRSASVALLVVIGCLLAPPLFAQSEITSINARAELDRLLATKGHFRKQRLVAQDVRECDWRPCHMGDHECLRCTTVRKEVPQTYTDTLRLAGNATGVVKGEVLVEPQFSVLPDQFHLHPLDVVNCSPDQPQSLTKTLAVNLQTTTSVQVTRGVTNTTTITGNVQFKFLDVGSASLTIQGSRAVNFSTTESQQTSNTLSQTEQVTLAAPPRTRSQAVLRVIEGGARAPFRATVVLDGPLDSNLDGKTMASHVLSEAERTVNVEGVLQVTSASQSQVVRKDLPVTAELCGGNDRRVEITEYEQTTLPADSLATDIDVTFVTGKSLGALAPARTLAGLFGIAATDSTPRPKRLSGRPFDDLLVTGVVGNICYIGPCNIPPDGRRLVCRYDDTGACFDCFDARDPVCDAPPAAAPASGPPKPF